MSKYSIKVDGKWEDLSFRDKRPIVEGKWASVYSVYVGDQFLGSGLQHG